MNEGDLCFWWHLPNQPRWGTIQHLEQRPGVKLCPGDSEAGEILYLDAEQIHPAAELPDGSYPGMSDTVYHQLPALSASGAKLLVPPSVPAKYRQQIDNPPESKPHFDFGRLVHALVLGEGADIALINATDWRIKAARDQRDRAHADGKIPVLGEDYAQAVKIRDAVMAHPTAGDLFKDGQAETSLLATDPETGVRLKARPDWMTERGGRCWIIDLKTTVTAEPKAFARKAADYLYHLQSAFYCHVARLLRIDFNPAFVLCCVEKEPPYLVSVVEFDIEAMTEGARLARKAIDTYAICLETGVWTGYPDGITPISLPAWAFRNDYEMDSA